MSERRDFILACLDRSRRITDICREFGVSEKTGYKILRRYRAFGEAGLEDRSHAVLEHPFRITPEVQECILALKREHPDYGPRLIHDRLVQHEPGKHWPAASSISNLLKRHGLVRKRPRRNYDQETVWFNSHLTKASEPNLVWTADFKGQFKLRSGHGVYCYPLTVMDLSSHFLLGIKALDTTSIWDTKREFSRIFREYGLPRVVRTDNGVPFAQPNSIGRLGQLALWWVRLGIKPEHISPGKPSENGAHERFHRTLKAAATKPASVSFALQQQRFDGFREEYNAHRPHSSLKDHKPPGEFYRRSSMNYPDKLPPPSYPDGAMMRLVIPGGHIKWRNKSIFLSSNMVGQYVGIVADAEESFSVLYGNLQLGRLDTKTSGFTPELRWIDPI